VTKQDFETMQARMNERMNDPKVKQAMAAMQGMGSSMAASAEVKKTGVSRKVAGFACEEWAKAGTPSWSSTNQCPNR
jgi:hypothetical protein